jgi:hypothetical protein
MEQVIIAGLGIIGIPAGAGGRAALKSTKRLPAAVAPGGCHGVFP